MKLTETYPNWGITVLRVAVGATFLMHGWQKFFVYGVDGVAANFAKMGMPWPHLNAALLSSAECFCGAALLLGVMTRIAAIPLAFAMFIAFATVHGRHGFFLEHQGFEYVMVLFAANIALMLLGSGPLAVDNLMEDRLHMIPAPPAPPDLAPGI